MALSKLMKTSGIAALAAGLAFVAVPSAAMAEPGDHGRGGWQGQSGGQSGAQRGSWGGGNSGGGWSQRQAPAQREAPQARPQFENRAPVQAAPQARGWNSGQPNAGWQARAAQGGHYGRDWNNGGVVNRPAQAGNDRTATPGQNGWQRNPAYSDPNRNRDYGARRDDQRRDDGRRDWRTNDGVRQQGWNGQRWNGQNWDRNADNRGNWQRDRNRNWNRDHDRDNNWQRDRNGGWNGNRNYSWNRDWRRDNRYNWSGWRNDHRDVFRMGRYYSPYNNWSYRRLSIGFFLDSGFYGSNYWIDDPYAYRLPPAYGPYRWIRYYDDAMLVNIYDGEVVDVIYDFFW